MCPFVLHYVEFVCMNIVNDVRLLPNVSILVVPEEDTERIVAPGGTLSRANLQFATGDDDYVGIYFPLVNSASAQLSARNPSMSRNSASVDASEKGWDSRVEGLPSREVVTLASRDLQGLRKLVKEAAGRRACPPWPCPNGVWRMLFYLNLARDVSRQEVGH